MRRIASYLADLKLNTRGANRTLGDFDRKAKRTGDGVERRFAVTGSKIKGGLVGIAVAAGVGLVSVIGVAAQLEEGLVGVQKTTGLADGQIQRLKRSLFELGRTLPVPIEKLIDTAKVAGQLGISGVDNIQKFVAAFAKLEIASDGTISGELGAQNFARFLENSGAGVDAAENLASAFTLLGNTSKFTEGQLLATASEVAQVSKAFGLSATDVLGLSAAFTELNVRPEVARTTVLRFFKSLEDGAIQGGKQLTALTKITGLNADEIRALQKEDPAKVFVAFAKGIASARKEGGDINKELKALGLNGTIAFSAIANLSTNVGTLEKGLKGAAEGAKDNSALNKEAAAASKTFNSELKILNNSFVELGDAIAGSGLISFLSDLVSMASKTVQNISDIIRVTKELIALSGPQDIATPDQIRRGITSASQANLDNRVARNIGRSITPSALQGLIRAEGAALNNGGFIQEIEQRGLLTESVADQIRAVRQRQAAERRNPFGQPQPLQQSQATNVEINNDIKVEAPNPQQAGNEISRITQGDIALGVSQ